MSKLHPEPIPDEILRERRPKTNYVVTPKLIALRKKLEAEHRRYMVKCLSCRQTGVGADINEAHFAVKHNEGCDSLFGLPTFNDSIDLSITDHF